MNACQEQINYRFEDAPNKVRASINLKRATNDTSFLWGFCRSTGFPITVWSANGRRIRAGRYVCRAASFRWRGTVVSDLWKGFGYPNRHLSMGGGLEGFLETIAEAGYRIWIPEHPTSMLFCTKWPDRTSGIISHRFKRWCSRRKGSVSHWRICLSRPIAWRRPCSVRRRKSSTTASSSTCSKPPRLL